MGSFEPPVVTIDALAGKKAEAAAVKTFAAFRVGIPPARSGGLAVVPTGTVQFASVCPAVQAGAAEAVNVSVPKLPVSVEVLIKRCPVVLG